MAVLEPITEINNRPKHNIYEELKDGNKNACMKD
jgi:hypothetical protein